MWANISLKSERQFATDLNYSKMVNSFPQHFTLGTTSNWGSEIGGSSIPKILQNKEEYTAVIYNISQKKGEYTAVESQIHRISQFRQIKRIPPLVWILSDAGSPVQSPSLHHYLFAPIPRVTNSHDFTV